MLLKLLLIQEHCNGKEKGNCNTEKGKSLSNILQQSQELQPGVCPVAEVVNARLDLCPARLLQQEPWRNAHLGFLLNPKKRGTRIRKFSPSKWISGQG